MMKTSHKQLQNKYDALLNKYSALEKDFEDYKRESIKLKQLV